LHHIIEIPLFAVLFDLFYIYCLFSVENFQDIDFEDLEQQQAGLKEKYP
jgi:hypothetical protein